MSICNSIKKLDEQILNDEFHTTVKIQRSILLNQVVVEKVSLM